MSGIEVKKSTDGFIVTKNGQSVTVKDKNKNGVIDKGDIWSGEIKLTQKELWEASGLSLGTKEEKTTEEMARYSKFLDQRDAIEQKEQQQKQTYTQQTQKPQKRGFWGKLGNFCMSAMPFLPMVASTIGILGSFSLNRGNAADSAIKWGAISNMAMMGMNSAVSMAAIRKVQQGGAISNPYGGYGGYSGVDAMTMINRAIEADLGKLGETEDITEDVTGEKTEKQKEARNQKVRDILDKIIENSKKDNSVYESTNIEYLKSLKDPDKTRDYTDEEIKNINQIQKTPSIPLKHIDSTGEDKTKLTPGLAESVNKLLVKYENATGDKKLEVMTEANYKAINTILKKDTLTEQDVNILRTICKE